MKINAEKCLSNGSNPGLGYIVNPDRTFSVDEEAAAVVREIFERFASGERRSDIIRDLQRRKITTSQGKEFRPNSFSRLLHNKRYIGVYMFQGKETPGGMPRILDDALFYKVQEMMERSKNMPGRVKAKDEYLLTTKLFCGYCKEMMVGYGGTGKSGQSYHYYCCKKARKHQCQKKIVGKEMIEDRVVAVCLELLTDENMAFIAQKVVEECSRDPENITIKTLKRSIKEANTAIENLLIAVESGQAVEMLSDRLKKRQAEKDKLESELAMEQNKVLTLTEPQVYAFLDYVRSLPTDDIVKRRAIINIFVNAIYLYDDHFTLVINASNKPVREKDVPLDDIEEALEKNDIEDYKSSAEQLQAPPQKNPNFDTMC